MLVRKITYLLRPHIAYMFKVDHFSKGHIQISQVPNRNEPNSEGEINYGYVFKLLQSCNYDGWIGCEYVPRGTV